MYNIMAKLQGERWILFYALVSVGPCVCMSVCLSVTNNILFFSAYIHRRWLTFLIEIIDILGIICSSNVNHLSDKDFVYMFSQMRKTLAHSLFRHSI